MPLASPCCHPADRAVEIDDIVAEPLEVVVIVLDRLERRRALARRHVGQEDLDAVEVVDRPRHRRLEQLRREAAQGDLGLVLERVVADPVVGAQAGAVDLSQPGEVGLGRRLLGRVIGVGDVVAEPVAVAQVAAEQRLERIALEARLVGRGEQREQPGVRRRRVGRGRRRGLGDRRHAGEQRDGRHAGEQGDGEQGGAEHGRPLRASVGRSVAARGREVERGDRRLRRGQSPRRRTGRAPPTGRACAGPRLP